MNSLKEPVFIIAEIAQAHEGSVGIAHSYIDALASTGVDAVKFQTHIAEAESSALEPFRVRFSYEDISRYDYWKRMEFTEDQWKGLKDHCEKVGLEFISSPFSIAAADLLERLAVKRYKIGSGEVTNLLLLDRIGRTGKPVILSSGMSSVEELRIAVEYLQPFGIDISLLQCTTAYPTHPEQWGLNILKELQDRFRLSVGFSDHSGDIFACLSAAVLGASVLEFHAVFDKQMFGPDAKASLTIDQIKSLVKGVREIKRALSSPARKDSTEEYTELKRMFGKTLAINKALKRGHILELADLESKKPGDQGIKASEFKNVVGKRLVKDLPHFSFLTYEDIE